MFRRILVANRGEIAVRIIRACREMNIETVAVYSAADADALHVQLATRAVCIGPAKASQSYLNEAAVLPWKAAAKPCIRATAFCRKTPSSRALSRAAASCSSGPARM